MSAPNQDSAAPESSAAPEDSAARPSQIIRNVLVNWTAFAVTLLTGFWMQPFLINNLGTSEYGVWVLTGSLVGYLGLLDFGITPSTVKFIAEHRARGDQEAINRVVTGGLFVFSIAGVISLLASVVLGRYFNTLFNTTISDSTAALVVFLVGLNLAVTFPASVYLGVLRGYQRYDIGAAATSVTILARSGFIVWAILQGYGLVALAALTLAFESARLIFVIWRVYRINPLIRFGRSYLHKTELSKLFGHSVWIFLIMVGDQINFYTDAVIIGLFMPAAAITMYSIAFRLVGYLRSLVVEMVGVLMPAVSGLHAREDKQAVGNLLISGTRFTLLLALPPAAVFFLLGDTFISLWIGKEYAESSLLLRILTFGIVANVCEMTVTTVLVGMGQARVVALFVVAQAVVNLVLSIILIRPYGLEGVALATTLSMTLFPLFSIPFYLRNYLQEPVLAFLRRAFWAPILIQVPWIAALVLVKTYLPIASLAVLFGTLVALVPAYGFLVYRLCLNASEKASFGNLSARFGFKPATTPDLN